MEILSRSIAFLGMGQECFHLPFLMWNTSVSCETCRITQWTPDFNTSTFSICYYFVRQGPEKGIKPHLSVGQLSLDGISSHTDPDDNKTV